MTTENNKLIDTFNENKYYKLFFSYDEMLYHKNWNWLMEVVEKIESLIKEIPSLSFQITNNHISIVVCGSPLWADIRQFSEISKKESVYNACIEFIKWYNNQN